MMTAQANRNVSCREPINKSDLRSWAEWHTRGWKRFLGEHLVLGLHQSHQRLHLHHSSRCLALVAIKCKVCKVTRCLAESLSLNRTFWTTPWRQGSCFSFPGWYRQTRHGACSTCLMNYFSVSVLWRLSLQLTLGGCQTLMSFSCLAVF